MSNNSIEEMKKLGFNLAQRKYILRMQQSFLEEKNELLKEIIALRRDKITGSKGEVYTSNIKNAD